MRKYLIAVLALALTVGMAFAAYAEVQNVKVSGDIIASGVARNHFNLAKGPTGNESFLKQRFLMSQIRVRVDADLTDNVMATVRLINERLWNGQNDTSASGDSKIDVDLAYVTLKEFLYSPLNLTIGRQEMRFGNGLIIGNAKVLGTSTNIPSDLTERKAFDAIRATLNYDPLVVDLVYAQVRQTLTDTSNKNTIDLAGVNVTYALNKKVDLSAYYFLKKDKSLGLGIAGSGSRLDAVNTIGGLITVRPVEDLTASFEGAYQFGRNDQVTNTNQRRHDALALQGMADYTFSKVKMTPKIGGSYTYLSGSSAGDTRNGGWDPMFYDQKLNNIVYTLLPFSNMSAYNLKASLKPVDDVTLSAVYGYYNVAQTGAAGFTVPFTYDGGTAYYAGTYRVGKTYLGQAIDVTAVYDYTEDVQFALTGGMFTPGDALTVDTGNATQLIGSMKVAF